MKLSAVNSFRRLGAGILWMVYRLQRQPRAFHSTVYARAAVSEHKKAAMGKCG